MDDAAARAHSLSSIVFRSQMERRKGLEPSTCSLGSCHSTTELPPLRIARLYRRPFSSVKLPSRRALTDPARETIIRQECALPHLAPRAALEAMK